MQIQRSNQFERVNILCLDIHARLRKKTTFKMGTARHLSPRYLSPLNSHMTSHPPCHQDFRSEAECMSKVSSLPQQHVYFVSERILALIQKPHFMNASRYYEGTFSCAVDCFLEVWIHVLSDCIPQEENQLILLLKNIKVLYEQYVSSNNISELCFIDL